MAVSPAACSEPCAPGSKLVLLAWITSGMMLVAGALGLNLVSHLFGPKVALADMPAIQLAAALCGAGLLYLGLVPLILVSANTGIGDKRGLILAIGVLGIAARLALFGSVPAFEDDWYRYLWDGAVTANGYNPYAVSPDEAQGEAYYYSLQPLAQNSGVVIERINNSHLKTIYPPVAQATFALAYILEPWSLEAWRALCVTGEGVTFALLLALLRMAGRPAVWVALYWWNPLVIKELINSAHMEAIVTPFVLAALLLAVRGRTVSAMTSIALATGTKLWPALLVPLLWRTLIATPGQRALGAGVFVLLCALWAAPPLLGGIDHTSGFVAYVQHWRNNSAHFAILVTALRSMLDGLAVAPETTALVARLIVAVLAGLVAVVAASGTIKHTDDLMARAGLVTAALFLLTPSQFPWYAIWMLPFVIFRPWLGLLAVTALIPIYYVSFHFQAQESYAVFRDRIVWLIWMPVWILLAAEGWRVIAGKDGFLFVKRTC